MSRDVSIRAGDLVDLFDEGALVCAVVVGEEKGRLKVVTETGRELRVAPSRVAHRAGSVSGPDAAGAALGHARATLGRLEQIDLPALWDVLVDEPARHTLGSLAALALGEDTPVARSAMLRALQRDRTWFTRRMEEYEPRPREQVEETHRREAALRAKEERRAAFLGRAREALAAVPAPPAGLRPGDPEFRDHVADLVELAIMGEEAASRRGAVALLDEAGVPEGTPSERAFRLLVALGVFHKDENLFVHRFGLKRSFPPEVESHARRAAAAGYARVGRRDLRDLHCVTIDDELTTELDDALSVETDGPALRVGIHIADPGCFVAVGDPVDREAMSRAATFYFPDMKLPMMPSAVAEVAASLVAGEDRPALSFLVTLSPLGEVTDWEVVPSVIRARARLTYEQADRLLDEGVAADDTARAVSRLRPVCEALEAERVAAGAVVIRSAEVDIRVTPAGDILIRRIDERGASRRLVSECMILANRLSARFCAERGIPAIYRRQAAPLEPGFASATAAPAAGGLYDPVAVRAMRRRMRRGESSLTPAPHHGLGLPAYTQATSPIRRFQDLVVHRQIKAALAREAPPYDAEALARIAATTEEAERSAREAERGTDEYWILRHYEARAGETIEGVVVSADARRAEVELTDTLHNVTIPPRPDLLPGRRLSLRIESSRPRAGRLTLRILDT